jgi:hypothetical protein
LGKPADKISRAFLLEPGYHPISYDPVLFIIDETILV